MNAPADNCPGCLTEESAVTVVPYWEDCRGEEIRAWYRCPECSHHWSTSWAAEALQADLGGAA